MAGTSVGDLVYLSEQFEWTVRSVGPGFILPNVELCYFNGVVLTNVLRAFEWHARLFDALLLGPANFTKEIRLAASARRPIQFRRLVAHFPLKRSEDRRKLR